MLNDQCVLFWLCADEQGLETGGDYSRQLLQRRPEQQAQGPPACA